MAIWNTISFVGDFCLDFPFGIMSNMSIRHHVVPDATLSSTPHAALLVTAVAQVPTVPHVLIPTESDLCQLHHVLM